VDRVESLTDVPDLIADLTNPPLLFTTTSMDPATLAGLKRKITNNPIYLNMVSRDGKGAAILRTRRSHGLSQRSVNRLSTPRRRSVSWSSCFLISYRSRPSAS
jgi:hypothetical protein